MVSDEAALVVGVQLRALGPVEAVVGGELVDLGPPKQRALFALLLSRVDRPVAVDTLIEELWSGNPPAAALASLLTYVSNLRRALEPHRPPRAPATVLRTRAPGYLLDSHRAEVDIRRFSTHATAGHEALARGDSQQAVREFDVALGLWRGPPYADMRDAGWAMPEIARLEELRLSVIEGRFAALLELGPHPMTVAELEAHVRAHPLREHGCELLALALYRGGRQAEALGVLRATRMKLVEELGIDPGTALQRLEREILTQASTLDWHPPTPTMPAPAPATALTQESASTAGPQLGGNEGFVGREAPTASLVASVSGPRPVPRQLPAHTPHFVGRATELRQLTTLLGTTTVGGGTVVITAIEGTAGIGKTALALHWAHQVAERFADGQLYVNLRGFDPTNTPVDPAAALRGFLDAFEISPERIPPSMDAQAGLYRGLLTDRRVLVVLDNARDEEQVRPLLPASPNCLVVITSRNQLAGLIAQQGARPLTLDVLTPREARALLARHLGPQRVGAEPRAITNLIKYCARLPLALAIVAARAATHPGFELRVLAKELADEHTRLDALDTGDPTASVRAVFSWSYQHLRPPAARMFRLLGLHPGPDITLPAATHLTDIPLHQAREALRELTRAHLLTQHIPGRFTFHDLLRAYATHLATTHDPPEDHHAALTRLFDHYLHTTAVAMDTLHSIGQHDQLHIPSPTISTPPGADPATAQHWLNTERANLAAIITYTAAHGWHTHTTRLANTVLLRYLETGVRYPDALALYTHVQHAAHHTNDHTTEALALAHLGLVYWEQGCHQQATDHLRQALTISRDTAYRAGEALALAHLALVHWQQGRYQQTTDHLQQVLTISRDIGYRAHEAFALAGLGFVHGRRGRSQQATDHYQQALAISRDLGYRVGEVLALTGLGFVYSRQDDYQQATDHYQQALAISRDTGYRAGEARALTGLGLIHGQQGHYQQATDHLQQALAICRDIGDRADEAQILNGLGQAHHANRQLDQARTQHTAALSLAIEIGDRYEQAHAHHGLAHTHHTTGDLDQAHHHWQQALTLYTDLGVPHDGDLHSQ
jgi:DNA-binding SARP family transcriptional activator/tetratricopeptide (TPR) repeat protein